MVRAGLRNLLLLLVGAWLVSCDRPEAPEPLSPSRADSVAIYTKAFSPPESCATCHPRQYREWELSMHAYAIEDPVFHSMNAEGLRATNGLMGEFCTGCHAPIATKMSEADGGRLKADLSPAGRRGVTCDACHKSESQLPGMVSTGYRLDGIMYGPISDPVPNSFHGSKGRADMDKSVQCAGCHDVVNPRGVKVEATFSEWASSSYPGRDISCQVCHMKWETGQAALGGPSNRRVHSHYMDGVDIPLKEFPGRDEMIGRVLDQLRYTVKAFLTPPASIRRGSTIPVKVEIVNTITGHNVPSGTIFERQMWVQLIAVDSDGDTIFTSGMTDPLGDLCNENSEYVAKGLVPRDSSLVMFHGKAFRLGKEIPFFFDADAIVNLTIPPYETRYARYAITPQMYAGSSDVTITARLFMRALPPYFLRKLGHADLVKYLPSFTMEEMQAVVQVK
ncbi:MAG: multiheme c-type cytochrome [Candidatus Kapaibacterium sp.]